MRRGRTRLGRGVSRALNRGLIRRRGIGQKDRVVIIRATDLSGFDGLVRDGFVGVSGKVGLPGAVSRGASDERNAQTRPSKMRLAIDLKAQAKITVAGVGPITEKSVFSVGSFRQPHLGQ